MDDLWKEYLDNPRTQRDRKGMRGAVRLWVQKSEVKLRTERRSVGTTRCKAILAVDCPEPRARRQDEPETRPRSPWNTSLLDGLVNLRFHTLANSLSHDYRLMCCLLFRDLRSEMLCFRM